MSKHEEMVDIRAKITVYANDKSASVVTYLPINIISEPEKCERALESFLRLAKKMLYVAIEKNKETE